MAKGLRKSIKQSTHTRDETNPSRGLVSSSGPKGVESLGTKRYILLVRDDFYGLRGCRLCATRRTLRIFPSRSSRILVQKMSL